MIVLYLFLLSIFCGIFGRMGGAGRSGQWYEKILNTKWRDAGCSLLVTFSWWLIIGHFSFFWWVYLIVFGANWAAFTTYWDSLFGFDNLWFSGFMVGLASLPLIFIVKWIWIVILIRSIVLAVIWGVINKFLPSKVFIWRHDVAEEFLRYKSVII